MSSDQAQGALMKETAQSDYEKRVKDFWEGQVKTIGVATTLKGSITVACQHCGGSCFRHQVLIEFIRYCSDDCAANHIPYAEYERLFGHVVPTT